jgi:hypothetical protein
MSSFTAYNFDISNSRQTSQSNLHFLAIPDDYNLGQETAGHDVTSLGSLKHAITMEVPVFCNEFYVISQRIM